MIYHIFKNNTYEFFEILDLFTANYYLSVYEKDTEEYLGTRQFDNVPLGITKKGNIILLADDNLDNLAIEIVDITKTKREAQGS